MMRGQPSGGGGGGGDDDDDGYTRSLYKYKYQRNPDPVTNLPIASRWHRHSRIFAGKELSFKQEVAKDFGRKYVSTDPCWE